jgi:hypothetical protein
MASVNSRQYYRDIPISAIFIPFQLYSLITNIYLETQYREAHIINYVKKMHDPKEHATIELLENILNKILFKDKADIFVNF